MSAIDVLSPAREAALRLPGTQQAQPSGRALRPVTAKLAIDPTQPMLAAPDVPAAIGWTMLVAYGWILLVFWLTFGAHSNAAFMVGVSTAYGAVFAAVPLFFFRLERKARPSVRRSWAEFQAYGLDTFTGSLGAKAAMAQILSVPIALAFATTGIGLAIAAARIPS